MVILLFVYTRYLLQHVGTCRDDSCWEASGRFVEHGEPCKTTIFLRELA